MKKPVLFIHSAGTQGPHAGSGDFIACLQDALGADYHVINPKMADPENPQYKSWKIQLKKELAAVNGEVILVGHSLGGSVLLKYLSEEKYKITITGLCIIAAPYWGKNGWNGNDFALQEDLSALLPIPQILLYHSRDDEVVPVAHLILYANKLPQATIYELDGRGHLFTEGCAEIAADIKNMHLKQPL